MVDYLHPMAKFAIAVGCGFMLSGCIPPSVDRLAADAEAERVALMVQHDQICQSSGTKPNSEPYARCRWQLLEEARRLNPASVHGAATIAVGRAARGPASCAASRVGDTVLTDCF